MDACIKNCVRVTFTRLVLDWFRINAPHWYVFENLSGVPSRSIVDPTNWMAELNDNTSQNPRVGWGVIVDEEEKYVFFSHPPSNTEEDEIINDIRRIYPTSSTFFDDLLLSIAIIDKRMRAECDCGMTIPGTRTMVG